MDQCLPAFLFVHFQCCEELQGCCRASLHTKATKKPEVLHQSRLFPESDKEEYTVAAYFCSHLSRWQQPVIWCALSIHSDSDTSRSMVTVFCETCLLSFSVGVSASQESSMTSSLSGSWWLWPYFRVMPPITATEVKPAVKKMKCGPDSIPAGVWKHPGCHNASILASQFNWIISHDEVIGLDDQHYSAHLEGQRWCHEVHKLSADLEKAFNWILKELIFALQAHNVPEDHVQSNCLPKVQDLQHHWVPSCSLCT